jgi:hypothetical protein
MAKGKHGNIASGGNMFETEGSPNRLQRPPKIDFDLTQPFTYVSRNEKAIGNYDPANHGWCDSIAAYSASYSPEALVHHTPLKLSMPHHA